MAQGGQGPGPVAPPWALVVRVLGPGRVSVGHGAWTLAELRGGVVGGPGMDVFQSRWLAAHFASVRGELAELHAGARAQAEAKGERWADLGPDVIRRVSQAMVRRFLAAMVSAHHGGTVVILPPETAEDALHGRGPLRLKYAFRDDEPRRRYRRLILRLMAAIARAGAAAGVATVDSDAYASLHDDGLASLREAIFEMSQLIASLSEVDGAVVITQRFEILGFGAELSATCPTSSTSRARSISRPTSRPPSRSSQTAPGTGPRTGSARGCRRPWRSSSRRTEACGSWARTGAS